MLHLDGYIVWCVAPWANGQIEARITALTVLELFLTVALFTGCVSLVVCSLCAQPLTFTEALFQVGVFYLAGESGCPTHSIGVVLVASAGVHWIVSPFGDRDSLTINQLLNLFISFHFLINCFVNLLVVKW